MNQKEIDMTPAGKLEQEWKPCDHVYESVCKAIRKQPGYMVNWQLVDKAWSTAKVFHHDMHSKSGELYVTHHRSVTEDLAKLRCKSSVLATTLLYDNMEDCSLLYERLCEDFFYEGTQIVNTVTKIKAEEQSADPHYVTMSADEQHAFLGPTNGCQADYISYQREAFLNPAARKLGMRYFEVVLNDLCMRYDDEELNENESA